MIEFFSLSHGQRSAVYDLISSFGLEHSSNLSTAKTSIEFFAKPTNDGIGFDQDTRDCLAALLALCGGGTIDDWEIYKESSTNSGGIAFKDGYRHIITVVIKTEPFHSLSDYGKEL